MTSGHGQPGADGRAEADRLRREIALLRQQLAEARSQVASTERLAELGTLTSGLAHEIKNPLSTVQLNLQLLGEDLDPTWPGVDRARRRLATVQRETSRLRDILDAFLRYAGKLELEPRPVDLQQLVEELVDFFQPQADLARVRIRVRPPPPQPVVVRADERLLKQTVLNLMLNAVQAMPDGGELMLAVGSDGECGILRVTDTGCGIPPEHQLRVFDAYFSTKRGGTGLGLAMARRIIREHNGTISLTSEPGKGTEFTIRLPLAEPKDAAIELAAEDANRAPPPVSPPGPPSVPPSVPPAPAVGVVGVTA